jgi:predicted house-cleaning noncanonical NTP pyrophosphatase (MazG superfamily)
MKVEAAKERQNLLADANREVQRQIEKGRALYEAEKERHKNEFKEQAVTSVELFSRQLLASIADHELHLAMIRKFKSALDEFVADLKDETGADGELNLRIASACQLSEEDENNLRQELEKRLGCRIKLAVAEDSDLIAGIKVFSGDKSYDASLSGQLAAFSKKIRAPI